MAIPTFVNAGARKSTPIASTITPDLPASLTVGNLLICVVTNFVAGAFRDFSWPSDWTEIAQHESTGVNSTVGCRIVDGTESAGPTITWTNGNTSADARIFQYTGNRSGNVAQAIAVREESFSNTATTTWTLPAVTTLANNSRVVALYAGGGFNSTINQPTGWDATDQSGGYSESTMALFGEEIAVAGNSSPAISETKPNHVYSAYGFEIMSESPPAVIPPRSFAPYVGA